jgi:ferritin-like metal-binding protein YciE
MTASDDARDTVHDIFAKGLRNAHAMEAQAKQLLERQIERLDDYPELRDRMQRHLAETEGQQTRLEEILRSMSEPTSTIKDAAMSLFGNMAAAAHMPASDEVLKNSFASFAFENYETAAYKSLIEVARLAGATEAVGLLRQSCEEEEAMAGWLNARLDSVTRQYVSRATGVTADGETVLRS